MPDKTIRYKVETTGGGAGSVDAVNGNVIVSKDITFALTSDDNRFLPYLATTQGSSGGTGSSELPPFNITPDANSSKWSWELMRGLNDTVETFSATGGSLKPYGISIIDMVSTDEFGTFTLQKPRNGAMKEIVIHGAATSHVIRVITDGTGVIFGISGTRRQFKHDSDPLVNDPRGYPVMKLCASGSSHWIILGQQSSGLTSYSSGLST